MNSELKNQIIKVLYGVTGRADKLTSIDEKRKLYEKYLQNNLLFLDLDENIDIESPEIQEIITDYFLKMTVKDPIVFDEDGYIPWLDSNRKDIARDFYNRYENYLFAFKEWTPGTIASLKKTSDIILDHMANPKTKNYFNKKGLVVGDIQSGKTANYTAVINKAIDAGYKIIIVLAGLTKDLRNQTQKRLDSEVLGYETKTNGKGKSIGVGTIKPLNIEGLTYSDDEKDFGDMKKYFSTHTLDDRLNPIVAIVKKNTSVLNHLNKFLTSSQDYCYTNKKLDIPVLIIDDEVDQASEDTKNSKDKEGASAINRKIRTILSNLNRYSYVGYTATPFANVFVDPDREDIYPKDFILCLPPSQGYCGIKEYFGVDIINDNDGLSDYNNDLFVNITDYKQMFSDEKITASTPTAKLNDSLKDAIKSFVIASSIKKSRGIIGYNSMLIHIARFKNPSTTLRPLISDYIDNLYHKLKYNYKFEIEEYKNAWENNFLNVSEIRLGDEFHDRWENIEKFLLSTIESAMTNIKVLNGDSGDVLDYSSNNSGDYIIIGGDKLSRGLTLEGLVVSYYYRNSKAYDSLLQMGRRFGYRKGWIDVCRVYTSISFMNNFITVGKVIERFKNDIEDMYSQHLNPREVGQRIMFSPNLSPTTRNKMRSATKIKISFSGEVQQIITFDRKYIESNFELTEKFIKSLGDGEVRSNNKIVFKNVQPQVILDYLKSYKECSSYYGYGHISIVNWIKYIENLNNSGELGNRTIILNSLATKKSDYDNSIKVGKYVIYKPTRTIRDCGDSSKFDLYTVKTNIDPTDFAEFFDPSSDDYNNIKHFDPTKTYEGFDSNNAIMSIYITDLFEKILLKEFDSKTNKMKTERGKLILDGQSVCAPAIWFPSTKNYEQSAISYYVTKDYLEREKIEEVEDYFEFGGTDNA